jgi:hypothetical protein
MSEALIVHRPGIVWLNCRGRDNARKTRAGQLQLDAWDWVYKAAMGSAECFARRINDHAFRLPKTLYQRQEPFVPFYMRYIPELLHAPEAE